MLDIAILGGMVIVSRQCAYDIRTLLCRRHSSRWSLPLLLGDMLVEIVDRGRKCVDDFICAGLLRSLRPGFEQGVKGVKGCLIRDTRCGINGDRPMY